MINKLIDIFIEWAKHRNRWPLLFLLLIPFAFIFTKSYFELSFKDTLSYSSFWIASGLIFILSGILYLTVFLQGLHQLRHFWISGPLIICGATILIGGYYGMRGGEYVAYMESNQEKILTVLKEWIPGVFEGDPFAQVHLGEFYDKGFVVSPNYNLAVKLYKQAARKGNSRAAFNLGSMYYEGKGVNKDPAKSIYWMNRANGLIDAEGAVIDDLELSGDLPIDMQDPTQLAKLLVKLNELGITNVTLVGPVIEMIDPPLSVARGISSIKAPQGTERVIVGRVTAPAGLLTFTVNDHEEKLDEEGLFRVKISIQRDNVPVKVVAIDKQGKRSIVEFKFTQEELPFVRKTPLLPDMNFGNYYALIIGNKVYTHWPDLATPENDATKISEVLERKYGFKTTVLLNATRYNILRSLNEFRKKLTENDNLLIYYGGHGHLEEKISRGYWIPVDGEIKNNVKWIPTFAITDILSTMFVRHILVVADASYSGALTRSSLVRLEAGMTDEARYHWLKVMSEKRSRTVLTSGDLQPVLDRGGGEHSVFAKAFLDVLIENNEILEGQRLYREISARVAYVATTEMLSQVPQYGPLKFAGHESGDFFFVPTQNEKIVPLR